MTRASERPGADIPARPVPRRPRAVALPPDAPTPAATPLQATAPKPPAARAPARVESVLPPLEARPTAPVQTLPVYVADDFRAISGANLGDPICDASELVLDDIYALRPDSAPQRLALRISPDNHALTIAEGSETGHPGAALHLDCVATFMSPDGATVETLLVAEVIEGGLAAIHVLPLAELAPRQDYALVGVDRDIALSRFAALGCVSFTRGTHITLATGEQRPVEDLKVGDKVLTRGNGAQPIRWIGRQTSRATGAFAPIAIGQGVLNNSRTLIVSPNHRLFVYQRNDALAVGRSEVLVKARHLVNGTTVTRLDGGFVDYFQLLFDSHEIIYAEGIAAESLLVDTRTSGAVPEPVRARMGTHVRKPHNDFEVKATLLDASTAADLLRRASLG